MEHQDGPVDWTAAARIAGRLVQPGPRASRDELTALVAELHDAAHRAGGHASRITGLTAADGTPPDEVSRVLVVDRPRWARANTQMFAEMTGPLATRSDGTPVKVPPGARSAAAVQVGGVLALLAGKVLGQFDPFVRSDDGRGRLLLVAPNVLHLERTLGLDASDFRLWVSLHEQTHALQFAAAPWLSGWLRGRAADLVGDLSDALPGVDGSRGSGGPQLADLVELIGRAVFGPEGSVSVLDLLGARQREVFEEIGAVMALLEGHADVAMDEVGPGVVPSLATIRRKFEAKRDQGAQSTGVERLLRKLLGMDVKLAQYRDGARFVRAVRADVGLDGFNAVFAGPQNVPTAREIADPRAWTRRVHG